MKEIKGAILSQNHKRNQEGGPGGPGPLNRNATNDTNLTKKSLVSSVSVSFGIFAYNTTRLQQYLTINNIDD